MLRFRYKAANEQGKRVYGKVEALSGPNAARLLNEQGLVVIRLSVEGEGVLSLLGKFRQGVGLGELATFTRQFATMINAGVTITEALAILRDQASKKLSIIVEQVLSDVEAGASLTRALEKHPNAFSPVYIALIRAGETGGILDKVLIRVAENLEKEREFRGKVVGALIYPIIIVVGMIIVVAIMLIFVIPRLAEIYESFQADLPITTQVVIGMSKVMSRFWWALAGVGALFFWGFSLFKKTRFGREKIDRLLLKIPVFGALQRHIMMTEFTRTLSLMVGAGVSILESLQVVAKVTGNSVLVNAVDRAARDVEKGFPLAWALGQQRDAFPIMVSRMIAVGEETGKVDEVLNKISYILETESEIRLRALTSTIEPVVMIILGVGVGLLVVSIILPIYNLTNQL